jgi:hypothetical protein
VTWRAAGGQHDVRADDGSFFLWADQKSSSGETRSQTFTEEGIVRYYCTLHGGPGGFGMSGIVYVGDAELETPPELHVPSEEHPTLRAALRDARQGSTIHLAPGVHRAGQRITQPGVTIVGTGDDPRAVVLRAATSAGVRVEADNVRLANLTIASGSRSGVLAEGVDRLRLDDVHVVTDEVGVRFDGGRGLTIHGGAVEGHDRAGVLVTGCDPCDARIEGLRAEGNLVGIDVVDAAGVFLRGNLLRGNGGGVRAADTPADPVAGPRTLVVTGNRFVDNDADGRRTRRGPRAACRLRDGDLARRRAPGRGPRQRGRRLPPLRGRAHRAGRPDHRRRGPRQRRRWCDRGRPRVGRARGAGVLRRQPHRRRGRADLPAADGADPLRLRQPRHRRCPRTAAPARHRGPCARWRRGRGRGGGAPEAGSPTVFAPFADLVGRGAEPGR